MADSNQRKSVEAESFIGGYQVGLFILNNLVFTGGEVLIMLQTHWACSS